MIRKMILFVATAVAAFALSSAAASAVVVENPGHFEIEGENTLHLEETFLGNDLELECDNDWEADITSSGHVTLYALFNDHPPVSQGNCDTAQQCNNEPWEGQIVENFVNNDHAPPTQHEFGIEVEFCLANSGLPTDGNTATATCEVAADEAHCEDVIPGIPGVLDIYLHGEVYFHEPVELMHEAA